MIKSRRLRSGVQRACGTVVLLALLNLFGSSALFAEDGLRGEALQQRVRQLATEALEEPGAVGLSVAVAVGDELLVEDGFGTIELEHGVKADADSVFRIGSITKQFTAAAVMKLIEEGASKDGKLLTLDAPISDFIDFPTQGKVVTVRELLTHTSGIKSYTGIGPEWTKTIPLEMTHEELLDLVKDLDFDFEPNQEFRYNNTGYYLLGVLIEEITGKSYSEVVDEMLFEPSKLSHLRYGSNSAIIPDRAQGYAFSNGHFVNDGLIGMSQPGAAGALISNAGDLVLWNRALVSGNVVSKVSYRQMTTPHVLANGEATGYGFGLGLGKLDDIPVVQHGGGINGFNSMLAYYPDQELAIAVISNSEAFSSGKLAERIARAALGIEIVILDEPISAAELQRVSGTFPLRGTPLELRVFARQGKLFAVATGQTETRLLSQGSDPNGHTEYRAEVDDSIRLVFEPGSPSPSLTLFQEGNQLEGPRKSSEETG